MLFLIVDLIETNTTYIMKTPFTLSKTFGLILTLMLVTFAFNNVNAQTTTQEKTIKGVISDEAGPLESASIILKGTKTGTTTDSKGEFTFPKPLKTDDVLLISFLGYETLEIKIKEDTTFLRLVLTEDLLEFAGALATDKPYKSKRKN
jgi:hypothetical protein